MYTVFFRETARITADILFLFSIDITKKNIAIFGLMNVWAVWLPSVVVMEAAKVDDTSGIKRKLVQDYWNAAYVSQGGWCRIAATKTIAWFVTDASGTAKSPWCQCELRDTTGGNSVALLNQVNLEKQAGSRSNQYHRSQTMNQIWRVSTSSILTYCRRLLNYARNPSTMSCFLPPPPTYRPRKESFWHQVPTDPFDWCGK